MEKRTLIVKQIQSQGVLPLFFHPDPEISSGVLKAVYSAGLRAIEYTNRGKEALKNFEILKSLCEKEMPGMMLGAGTIKDETAAWNFIEAGADFLVSPGLAEGVFDISYSEKILWIPGCMTISEIMKAEQFGLNFIKLFPGSVLGAGFMKAIRDIFPDLLFMPTGGVEMTQENLRTWFNAGVAAVGMGSKFITWELLEEKQYEGIARQTRQALAMIKEIRKDP